MPENKTIRLRCRWATAEPVVWDKYGVRIGLLLILLVTVVAYSPAMKGGFLWDDDAHVTRPEIQSLAGLVRIWIDPTATQQYYPLLHSTFWLEHKLWGDSVLGYHAITLFWHLLAVTLLYSVLYKLQIPGALLAAAIFALHPVMVESVAWVSEQKNTLSAVFYLAAMRLYLEFDESRGRSQYALALTLFVLGLLTKTVIATLPAALLVIFWWQRGTINIKRDVLPLLPFFALGTVAGTVTAWVEYSLLGAHGEAYEMSFLQRGLLSGRVVWFYFSKLVWPTNLTFIYPRWEIDATVWWQWLFPAATLGTLIVLWGIRKRSRGPLAAWLLFVGTLLPALGFFNVYPFVFSFVADHFQYLASIAMIVLIASGITMVLVRLSPSARKRGEAISVLLVAALAVLTGYQSYMYADSVRLYETTILRNPACWMAKQNLGIELFSKGLLEQAIVQFQGAIQLKPNYPEAHNNLGAAFLQSGEVSQGIDHLHESIRLKPDYFSAYTNLGHALVLAGQLPEAVEVFETASRLQPDDVTLLNNLTLALMQLNRYPEAEEHIHRALKIKPDDPQSHLNLGLSLFHTGNIPQATEQFEEALKFDSESIDAHRNLGLLYARNGETEKACAHFQAIVHLRPESPDAQFNLAEALWQTGHPADSIEHFQVALRLRPEFWSAYLSLARALAYVNKSEDAVATAEKGISTAHSAGQDANVSELEVWLQHYNIELHREDEKVPGSESKP